MADRMAIMKDGVFVQVGNPREIYQSPSDAFVASFVGETNFITGNIQNIADGNATIDTPIGTLYSERIYHDFTPGQEVNCSIRPEMILLSDKTGINTFSAEIGSVTYLGRVEEYELILSDSVKLKAIIHDPGSQTRKSQDSINFSLSPDAVIPLPKTTNLNNSNHEPNAKSNSSIRH